MLAIGAQVMYIACNDTSVIVIKFRKSKTHATTDTYCTCIDPENIRAEKLPKFYGHNALWAHGHYYIYESGKVGLGTTVEYTERKFKTKAKERHVAKNPWKKMWPSSICSCMAPKLPVRPLSVRSSLQCHIQPHHNHCRSSTRFSPGANFVRRLLPSSVSSRTRLYADDALEYEIGAPPSTISLQRSIDHTTQWAACWHGKFSSCKTELLLVGRQTSADDQVTISI